MAGAVAHRPSDKTKADRGTPPFYYVLRFAFYSEMKFPFSFLDSIKPAHLICALGLRFAHLRWEDISSWAYDESIAEDFLRATFLADRWPVSAPAQLKKIVCPQGAFHAAWDDLQKVLARGAQYTTPVCATYPEAFAGFPEKPLILTFLGHPFWMETESVSVVGSRHARSEVLRWLDHELPLLIRSGVAIISGGARGVDQKAHSVAIRCEGKTGIILPSGLENLYPADLKFWIDEVVSLGGALISEYAPDSEMRKHHFHQRNRLVAGFSRATLIAQCGAKSGTWMTASRAMEAGRELGVLPGPPWDAQFAGSLDLIFDGAQMIRSGEEALALMKMSNWGTPKPKRDEERGRPQ